MRRCLSAVCPGDKGRCLVELTALLAPSFYSTLHKALDDALFCTNFPAQPFKNACRS